MGICFRIVLVDGDEQPRRFPLARYERLLDGDPGTRMVELAGKRIRCACIAVDFVDRVPVQVVHCSYSFLRFDEEGRIDLSRQHEAMQLAAEIVIGPVLAPATDGVVHGEHRFAKRRYDHEHRWEPALALERAILDVAMR